MTRISSTLTFWYKRIFPLLWFGFLVLSLVIFIVSGGIKQNPAFIAMPLVMALIGFFFMKKLVWNLVDEVYDGGDFLLIKNRDEEQRVPLSDIVNVSATIFVNPPRVALRLRHSGKFGSEVTFSPAIGFRLLPFTKIPIVEDLIGRVDRARSRHNT